MVIITSHRSKKSSSCDFHSPLRALIFALILSTSVMMGCARTTIVDPQDAFREIEPTDTLVQDDLNFAGLVEAIQQQREVLLRTQNTTMNFGRFSVTRGAYARALDALSDVLQSSRSSTEKLTYIRENFRFFEIYGGKRWGEILLTGYFEPVIPGSLTKTERFAQPLYARPTDLVVVDLKKFSDRFKDEPPLRGRLDETRVAPYYTREEIDTGHKLSGRKLELCWVDPVDAFFLHIQGSGTIQLPNGEKVHLTYAEKNGQRYEPIGKFLKEELAGAPITMQRIEAFARSLSPERRATLFAKNPSYVFFQQSHKRAITSLGVPATDGRTIAADPKFAPKGALTLITFNKPTSVSPSGTITETERVSRFLLDQDSGGAIKGTDHIDLFWGRGAEAKEIAGVLQDTQARAVYLAPKEPQR